MVSTCSRAARSWLSATSRLRFASSSADWLTNPFARRSCARSYCWRLEHEIRLRLHESLLGGGQRDFTQLPDLRLGLRDRGLRLRERGARVLVVEHDQDVAAACTLWPSSTGMRATAAVMTDPTETRCGVMIRPLDTTVCTRSERVTSVRVDRRSEDLVAEDESRRARARDRDRDAARTAPRIQVMERSDGFASDLAAKWAWAAAPHVAGGGSPLWQPGASAALDPRQGAQRRTPSRGARTLAPEPRGLLAPRESSQIVTGPSLTSATFMSAPKTPVATGLPNARASAATNASNFGRAIAGRRRARPRRPVALARRCEQRELADREDVAAGVDDRAIHHAGVVVEDAQRHDLARDPVEVVVGVVRRHAGQHDEPGADRADGLIVDAHAGLAHPLDQRPHAVTSGRCGARRS